LGNLKVSGIYLIENLENGKLYIGQSKNVFERFKSHQRTARTKSSKSYKYPLYKDIRVYGIENFKLTLLERCHISKLNEREIYWIEKYKTFTNTSHYNKTAGGHNVSPKFKKRKRKTK